MSDIRINASITANTYVPPMQKPITKPEETDSKSTEEASSEAVKSIEYGPVIATSSDGDTVRVKANEDQEQSALYSSNASSVSSNSENYNIQDFAFPPKPPVEGSAPPAGTPKPPIDGSKPNEDEETENEAVTSDNSDSDSGTSTTGSLKAYSESQLQEMYLKGDISQVEYNREIDARNSVNETESSDTSELNSDMANVNAAENSMELTSGTINTLLSGNISDSIPIEIRMQALKTLDNM